MPDDWTSNENNDVLCFFEMSICHASAAVDFAAVTASASAEFEKFIVGPLLGVHKFSTISFSANENGMCK